MKAPRWWAGLWGRKAERLLAPPRANWPVWRLTCPTLRISQGHREAQGKDGGQFNRKASGRAVADAAGRGVERPGSSWGHCTAKSPPQPPGRSQWERHHLSGLLEDDSVHRRVHARCRHWCPGHVTWRHSSLDTWLESAESLATSEGHSQDPACPPWVWGTWALSSTQSLHHQVETNHFM